MSDTPRFEHDSRFHAIASDLIVISLVSAAVIGTALGALLILIVEGLR